MFSFPKNIIFTEVSSPIQSRNKQFRNKSLKWGRPVFSQYFAIFSRFRNVLKSELYGWKQQLNSSTTLHGDAKNFLN